MTWKQYIASKIPVEEACWVFDIRDKVTREQTKQRMQAKLKNRTHIYKNILMKL